MSLYFNTRRIEDIISRSSVLNYSELNDKRLRIDCFRYLAKVYQEESIEALTDLDITNLEDIAYMFCLPNFGVQYSNKRVVMTRNHIQSLVKGDITLENLMTTLSVNYLD